MALLGVWALGVALLVVRLAIAYVGLDEVCCELRRLCRKRLSPRSGGSPPRWDAAAPCKSEVPGRLPCLSCMGCDVRFWFCRSECAGPPIAGSCPESLRTSWPTWYRAISPGTWPSQAVSILLWFHPLAWRIGSAHRAACDAVCDAVAASYLGDVAVYCRTLAEVALEGAAASSRLGAGDGPHVRCPASHCRASTKALRRDVKPPGSRRRGRGGPACFGIAGGHAVCPGGTSRPDD